MQEQGYRLSGIPSSPGNFLSGWCANPADHGGELALSAFPSRRTTFWRCPRQAGRWAGRIGADEDVYVASGIMRRPSHGRGTERHVMALVGYSVDLDVGVGRFPDRQTAVDFVDELPLVPTVIVGSGTGGVHVHWLFKEPRPFDSDLERARAKGAWRGWVNLVAELARKHVGAEVDRLFDLTRIWRVPGTLNHKTDPAAAVTILAVPQ